METRNVQSGTAARRPVEQATKQVDFVIHLPQAKSVAVAGTFNNWDPKRTPLRRSPNGEWKTILSLPPGSYEYRFIVDGQWLSDPKAKASVKNAFGSTNSVRIV